MFFIGLKTSAAGDDTHKVFTFVEEVSFVAIVDIVTDEFLHFDFVVGEEVFDGITDVFIGEAYERQSFVMFVNFLGQICLLILSEFLFGEQNEHLLAFILEGFAVLDELLEVHW